MSLSAVQGGAWSRPAALAVLVLGIEYSRVLAGRLPGMATASLLVGGLALCLLALGRRPADLGLGRDRLAFRVLGGFALAAILLLPAAVRWGGGPSLPPELAVAAVAVSVGEEIAFRGALFGALAEAGGPALAVLGSTLVWTAAHALSHPPAFLPAVAAAGLLLGTWRWACRDLVGPVVGHVIADLSL
ncbi:MAG TPA: CPBP family intramembrane glutamic endopeptidase [Candidatus Dormibacteraeota bacterium]